ncbi:hypothetical protein [Paraburkholderia metrosideri]|nr:hypothetical protein [Paraburkholderia metrosideri]
MSIALNNHDQWRYLRQSMFGGACIAYLKTRDLATNEQRAQI